MPAAFSLIKFDPGNESHAHFVYDSFRRSINVWPWSHIPVEVLMNRLKRELATPGTETKIATPFERNESFVGWYSVRSNGNTIVYAFTKYTQRRQGIGRVALSSMGLSATTPIMVRFWTPASARIACKMKWDLIFDTRDAFDA